MSLVTTYRTCSAFDLTLEVSKMTRDDPPETPVPITTILLRTRTFALTGGRLTPAQIRAKSETTKRKPRKSHMKQQTELMKRPGGQSVFDYYPRRVPEEPVRATLHTVNFGSDRVVQVTPLPFVPSHRPKSARTSVRANQEQMETTIIRNSCRKKRMFPRRHVCDSSRDATTKAFRDFDFV